MPLSLREQRALCLASFWHFIRIVGESIWLPPGEFVSKDIHRKLCHFVQDFNIRRRGILMPRDWRKSSVFTKWYAIWRYLRNHEERIGIVAETLPIASNMLDAIETLLIQCTKLHQLCPELDVLDASYRKKHKWSSSECMLPRKGVYSEPTITAMGVGAAAQSRHWTLLILDDLCGKAARDSQTVLADTISWFNNYRELLTDPHYDRDGASEVMYVGTNWIIGDLPCYIMVTYPEFKWRVVPALKSSKESVDKARQGRMHVEYLQNDGQPIGQSNWPEQFTTEYYLELMANSETQQVFWSQHMNMPIEATGINTIKAEWFKYYRYEQDKESGQWYVVCKDDQERFALNDLNIRGVIDPGGFAQGTGIKKSSRNAFIIAGQARRSYKKFVLNTWTQRIASPAKMMVDVFAASDKYKVASWHVEVYAAQDYILKDIKEERDKVGRKMIVVPLPSEHGEDAKNKRIQGLINPFQNGEIYLHETQLDLKAELVNHPAGLTADLADCLGWHNKQWWSGVAKSTTVDANKRNYQEYISSRLAGRA